MTRSMDALDTPSLLLDVDRLDENLRRMQKLADSRGVSLRPHAKTHKSPLIGQKQISLGAVGLTVAKLGEAEVFIDAGILDLFVAFPIVSAAKIERLLDLSERARIAVAVDDAEVALAIGRAAQQRGQTVPLRLEVNIGLNRSGCAPEDAPTLSARIAGMRGVSLDGIFVYRGLVAGAERSTLGRQEAEEVSSVARAIRETGVPCPVVSAGSTPTAEQAASLDVTEIRPGTYAFYDAMQLSRGLCRLEDCAVSVLATVVSHAAHGRAVLDTGTKSLSADVGPQSQPWQLSGYGIICHLDGTPVAGATLERMTEEHGMVHLTGEELRVGDVVRVIPNHVCTTVNLYDAYTRIHQDGRVEDTLPVAARGRVR